MPPDYLCLSCTLAAWSKTANGRTHPSGQNRCAWVPPDILTPKAWCWAGGLRRQPVPQWGQIERRPRTPITECETYERKD